MSPRSFARAQLIAALLLACTLGSASAQTRFEWPDTVVNVARYRTVDECLAATDRVARGIEIGTARASLPPGIWEDTLMRKREDAMRPLPPLVVETATRCAARFPEQTADLTDFAPLLKLYLAASRDDDAAALVARRLAVVAATTARAARTAAADSAIAIYLDAHPARPGPVEKILLNRVRTSADHIESLTIYHGLMKAAKQANDTALIKRAAKLLVAVADSLTPAERESERFEELLDVGGTALIYEALTELTGQSVALDSLRRGTGAFMTLMQAQWSKATGQRFEALALPVGKHAPTIVADTWLPDSAGKSPRPTPGRASLVYFLDHQACMHYDDSEMSTVLLGCPASFAMLHRLAKRYPTLQITIVTTGTGFFAYEPPPSPAGEVDWIRKWMESHQAPGAIAVSHSPFLRFPAPDGRRINRDPKNFENYSFGKNWRVDNDGWFLADQDGVIVLFMGDEHDLDNYIDVLTSRQPGAGK